MHLPLTGSSIILEFLAQGIPLPFVDLDGARSVRFVCQRVFPCLLSPHDVCMDRVDQKV
jgi:hypothetical protein